MESLFAGIRGIHPTTHQACTALRIWHCEMRRGARQATVAAAKTREKRRSEIRDVSIFRAATQNSMAAVSGPSLDENPPEIQFSCAVFDTAFHPLADVIAIGLVSGKIELCVPQLFAPSTFWFTRGVYVFPRQVYV